MIFPLVGAHARIVVLIIYVFCAWRGDRTVRLAALFMTIATLATPLIEDHVNFADPGHRMVVLDLVIFGGLIALTLSSPRYWLVAASAFQLLSAGADLVIMGAPVATPTAWFSVSAGFTWGVTICVLLGAVLTPRRATPAA